MANNTTISEELVKLINTKAAIKQALIDKGQTPSDFFDTYDDEIEAIEIGTDTSDATAVADDIAAGKTAYVDGEKVTGTYVPLDTSDATAIVSDIREGQTAYVNGEKIIGTVKHYGTGIVLGPTSAIISGELRDQFTVSIYNGASSQSINKPIILDPGDHTAGYLTFSEVAGIINLTADKIKKDETVLGITGTLEEGIDTSDATATSADIAAGKTAYVNGQKITGIGAMTFATVAEMNAVTNVPEDTLAIVYGTDYVGTYRFDNGSWTEIGSKSVEQQSMDNLNALDGSTDQYEGLGGTEEQVNEVLDEIIEGSQEESGTTNGKHSGD